MVSFQYRIIPDLNIHLNMKHLLILNAVLKDRDPGFHVNKKECFQLISQFISMLLAERLMCFELICFT